MSQFDSGSSSRENHADDGGAARAPEEGRFERGVFIPARLDMGVYNLDDPDDVNTCDSCDFRCVGLGALVRHEQQEHGR